MENCLLEKNDFNGFRCNDESLILKFKIKIDACIFLEESNCGMGWTSGSWSLTF